MTSAFLNRCYGCCQYDEESDLHHHWLLKTFRNIGNHTDTHTGSEIKAYPHVLPPVHLCLCVCGVLIFCIPFCNGRSKVDKYCQMFGEVICKGHFSNNIFLWMSKAATAVVQKVTKTWPWPCYQNIQLLADVATFISDTSSLMMTHTAFSLLGSRWGWSSSIFSTPKLFLFPHLTTLPQDNNKKSRPCTLTHILGHKHKRIRQWSTRDILFWCWSVCEMT